MSDGIRGRNESVTATLNFIQAALYLGGPRLLNSRISAQTREQLVCDMRPFFRS